MPFHPGWLGLAEGFGYGGYYIGDGYYEHVGCQKDIRILGQENWMVQNPKSDDPVSQEATTAPGRWHEQDALKDRPSVDQLEGSREDRGEERVFGRWQSKARRREKSRGGGSRAK
jgi:hypothetical protein